MLAKSQILANCGCSGRTFDLATLPATASLRNSRYINAQRIESHQTHPRPSRVSDVPVGIRRSLSRDGGTAISRSGADVGEPRPILSASVDDGSSQALPSNGTSLEAAAERLPAAESKGIKQGQELGSSVDAKRSATSDGSSIESNIRTSEALPLSMDDVPSLPPSNIEELVAEQRPSKARNVHLPSKEAQEDRLLQHTTKTDGAKKQGTTSLQQEQVDSDSLIPPPSKIDLGRGLNRESRHHEHNERRPSDPLKAQMDVARAEAFGESPSTADEQLRLEEAKLMQPPQPLLEKNYDQGFADDLSNPMPPPSANGFVHDGKVDGLQTPQIPGGINVDNSNQTNDVQDHKNTGIERSEDLPKPNSGMRDHMFSGMNGDSSRDLTLSRRPPMRIDTGVPSISQSNSMGSDRTKSLHMPTPSDTETPSKSVPAITSAQSPPERMTTRVSSGALRHKSVSEILGETPKATPIQSEKGPFAREFGSTLREDHRSLQTPDSALSLTSPDPAAFRRRLSELKEKEKERSKLSTVVFASSRKSDVNHAQRSEEDQISKTDRDYMLTLFHFQIASPPRAHTLNALVKSAHKTLTTSDHFIDFSERQACRVLNRIYELQAKHCWSLRQLERSAEPARPVTHWDVTLGEMKWMRTDFKEERKWKLAAAKYMAEACSIWVTSSVQERKLLQVKVRATGKMEMSKSISATPELVHSADDEFSETTDDESVRDAGNAPAAIFSLPPDMFIFGLNKSPVSEKILSELPLYQPNVDTQKAASRVIEIEPDATWKQSLAPLSKYAHGKLVPLSDTAQRTSASREGPLPKRRRFNYDEADAHRRNSSIVSSADSEKVLHPEQDDVALFNPENKHIRDRIHSGHAFRPPSEYQMPSESFFVARQSSQWTQREDDDLRRIVREYSYNWSLISSSMTLPSMFTSGAERRTPWECFERWIGLEGLPVEMAKINYFRAYHSRLQQAAQKTIEAHQAAQQQQGNAAQVPRRRTTQPYTVDRRKDQKHIYLIDAMRKLAKKRETAVNKQQHGMVPFESALTYYRIVP